MAGVKKILQNSCLIFCSVSDLLHNQSAGKIF